MPVSRLTHTSPLALAAAISEAEALPADVAFFFVVFVVVVGVVCWVEVSACGLPNADGRDSENSRDDAASHVIVFICTLLIVFLSMLDGNWTRDNKSWEFAPELLRWDGAAALAFCVKPLLFNTSGSPTEQSAEKCRTVLGS